MRVSINFIALILTLLILVRECGATGINGTNTAESTNTGCYDHRGRMWYAVNSSFSALPCMSCKCNANGTLTCYRSIAPIPNRQCTTNGTSTSICITRQTSTTKFKQFCFNCNTSKTEFKMACIFCSDDYNAKSYYSGESWNPSSCIACNCMNGKANCFFRYHRAEHFPKLKASCMNCNVRNFVRAISCRSCKNYVTGRTYSSGSTWWINSCFICMCFRGRTFCRRESKVIVFSRGQLSLAFPLCSSCATYKLIRYMRRFQCKICRDDHNRLIRLHNETFYIAYNVICRCRDGVIQCNSTITGAAKEMFYVGSNVIACSKCSANDIKNLKEGKGCNFLNRTIREGHATHVGFGEMPYCMTCRCLLGKLQCISLGRIIENAQLMSRCMSEKQCTSISSSIRHTCERYAAVNCYNRPPVNSTWMANGCEYTCDGGTLKHKIIRPPWCQTISKATRCAVCPDIGEFFKKYGSIFTICKNYTEAVYREKICDGRNDCFDKTDEEHCTEHYCLSDTTKLKDKSFLWPRTRVGVVKKLNCKHIFPHWKGMLYRPCKINASIGTFWPKMDFCSCTDARPDPVNLTKLSNASGMNLDHMAMRVLNHSKNAVTLKRSLELAILVTEQSLSTQYVGQTSAMISMAKTLVKVMHSELKCSESEEASLRKTLEEKLKNLQFFRGFLVNMVITKTAKSIKSFASDSDDLFVADLLFGKSSDAPSVDSFQPKVMRVSGFGLVNLKTKHNVTINDSIYNASQVSMKKVKKKISIHVKIIFGFDAFMSIVSLLSLFIVLFFLFSLSLPKSTKWFIRKNLFVAVTISLAIYVVSIWAEHKMIHYRWLCTTFVLSNYYATLAMYSWMSVEGINLIIHIVLVFKRKSTSHRKFAAIGWGLPFVPFTICLAAKTTAFTNTKGCLGLGKNSWLFKGPAAVFIGANAIMYAVICRSLIKNVRSSKKLQVSANNTRSNVKPFLMLLPLLGVTYLIGFTIDESTVMKYIYVLVNDALGLAFAIVTFFMDSQVKERLIKMRENASRTSASDNMLQNASSSMVSIIAASPSPKRAETFDTKL